MLFRASEPLLRFRPRFRWDDDTAAYSITSSTRAICVTRKVETERLVGLEAWAPAQTWLAAWPGVRGKTLCQFECRSPTL